MSDFSGPAVKGRYLNHDKKTDRYYCQVKVPVALQTRLGVICKVFLARGGELSTEMLLERCAAQVALLRQKFSDEAKLLPTPDVCALPASDEVPKATTQLLLSPEIQVRAAVTAAAAISDEIQARMALCRSAIDAERYARIDELQSELAHECRQAKRAQFAHQGDTAFAALAHLEARFNIQLVGTESERLGYLKVFNAEHVAVLKAAELVLQGDESEAILALPRNEMLPLLELWGTSTRTAVERWQARGTKVGRPRHNKTMDKYVEIAKAVDNVLGRRPLETLNAEDVAAIVRSLRERGNVDNTIHQKLSILASLIGQLDEPMDRALSFIDDALDSLNAETSHRQKFTPTQLNLLLTGIYGDSTLPASHPRIVELMTATCARLEEVCQLRGSNIRLEQSQSEQYWLIEFCSAAACGRGDAKLKNVHSNRRIPVITGVFPDLDVFLQASMGREERLFPQLKPNKYDILSDAVSKMMNRRIDTWVRADRRLVLQSLRTTGAIAMRTAGVDYAQRIRFLGHAPDGVHVQHYEVGSQLDADDLLACARALAKFIRGAQCVGGSPCLHDAGQSHWQRYSVHRADQCRHRNDAVASADRGANMTSERVMNFLCDAVPAAQSLERVTQAMKNQTRVADATPLRLPKIASKKLSEISTPPAVMVRDQLRKQPLLTGPSLGSEIALETGVDEGRVQGHSTPRTGGFDALTFPVVNAHQQPQFMRVQVANTQLAQFLKASTTGQSHHGNPSNRISSAGQGPSMLRVDARAEDAFQGVGGKRDSPSLLNLGSWDFEPASNVRGQVPCVKRRLQHCAEE